MCASVYSHEVRYVSFFPLACLFPKAYLPKAFFLKSISFNKTLSVFQKCISQILQVSQHTSKIFLVQGAAVISALRPAEKTGRGMATAATSGELTRRTGLKLKTSARGRAATWPLSPRTPPRTLSWRG